MSALVAIVCDSCGDIGTTGVTPSDARTELPAWGRRQGMDLCPLCRLLSDGLDRKSRAVTT